MTPDLMELLRRAKTRVGPPGVVLECGAYDVNGTARTVFERDADSYVGIDCRSGPAVDQVLNAHRLVRRFGRERFDCVLSVDMLEHDDAFWKSVQQMKAVLKPGGWLIVSSPGIAFPLHSHPHDYWRLTEQALRQVLFRKMDAVEYFSKAMMQLCMGRKPQ